MTNNTTIEERIRELQAIFVKGKEAKVQVQPIFDQPETTLVVNSVAFDNLVSRLDDRLMGKSGWYAFQDDYDKTNIVALEDILEITEI